MEKDIFKGSFVLIVSGVICKILGAFFRIPLTNILGVEGIGVFQMVSTLYAFALILCSGGITVSLSKLIADARGKEDQNRINSLYRISLLISVGIGVAVGIIFCVFAKNISFFQGNSFCTTSYRIMIILLPLGAVMACLRGVIQGYENMVPTAISQVIEQLMKFIIGLFLAYILIGKGIEYAVCGAFIGVLAGEILSILYLFINIKRLKVKAKGNKYLGFYSTIFPILLGACVLPFVNAIDSLIIVNRLSIAGFTNSQSTVLFGLQNGVVGAILNFPLIISCSLSIAILPSLSYIKSQNQDASIKIQEAFKILWIVLLPMVLGIIAISKPLYASIYPYLEPSSLEYAVNLTRLGGVATILFALMQFFITVLQVKGKLIYLMNLQIFAGVVKILIVIFLCAIPEINIYGIILSNIAFSSIVCIGILLKLKNQIVIHYFDLIVPLFSAVIMLGCVITFLSKFDISNILKIAISVIIGLIVYGVLCFPCIISIFKKCVLMKRKKRV